MFYRLVYRDTVCFPPRFDKDSAVQSGEFDETQSIKPYTHYKHNQYAWARSGAKLLRNLESFFVQEFYWNFRGWRIAFLKECTHFNDVYNMHVNVPMMMYVQSSM
jgi:hypothetical protein